MSTHTPSRQPKGLPIGGQFAASARNEAEAVTLASDEAQAADYMAFMDPGAPPEPETGHCAECGDLWMADPDGSPGVKVHMDDETGRPDYDKDEDHTPVPEDDEDPTGANDAYPNGRCGACGFGLDTAGLCYQHDCSNFDSDSELADLGSLTSGETLDETNRCWSCHEDGYTTQADTFDDDNGPLCEGCAQRRAEDEAEDDSTDLDETDDEIIHEFQTLGSSSDFAVTRSDDEDADEPYSLYRDGHWVGTFDYDGDPDDHAAIEQAVLRVFPNGLDDEQAAPRDDQSAAAAARYASDINASGRDDQVAFLTRMGYRPDRVAEVEKMALLDTAVTIAARDVAEKRTRDGGTVDDVWATLNNEPPAPAPVEFTMTPTLAYRANARWSRAMLAEYAESSTTDADHADIRSTLAVSGLATLTTLRGPEAQRMMSDDEKAVIDRLDIALKVAEQADLKVEWDAAYAALKDAGVAHDADDPVAARYRNASNAVNQANRRLDFAIATDQARSTDPVDAAGRLAEALQNALAVGDNYLGD